MGKWSFFGCFGLKPEDVEVPAFNYVGVAIACLRGAVFLAIRVGKSKEKNVDYRSLHHSTTSSIVNKPIEIVPQQNDNEEVSSTISIKKRFIGCSLAIVTGIFFDLVSTSSTHIQDHRDKYPEAAKKWLSLSICYV
ncbi:unnamed protein product [Rotaria sp. Silwood1]|nr:unnamed protein product [Rotaria sp. Silwood1]